MPFPDNLRAARQKAGYKSQEAAARAYGVSLHTWARWETGIISPSLETLGLIGELLKIAPAKLLEEPDDETRITCTSCGFSDSLDNFGTINSEEKRVCEMCSHVQPPAPGA